MNESTVSGKFDQAAGKVKQAVGNAVGNEKLANSGAADEVKGDTKETWGNVKDTASSLGGSTRSTSLNNSTVNTGEATRDKITTGAENMKNKISNKLDELKGDR